jgi:hypothetical protein
MPWLIRAVHERLAKIVVINPGRSLPILLSRPPERPAAHLG